jgi:hypothetical protein
MTYIPKSAFSADEQAQYPFGLTRIFLRKDEYDLISELPDGYNFIRIIYQKLSSSNSITDL